MPGDRAIMNMVGSPLNDFERTAQLFIDRPAAPEPTILNDNLYAINSIYMEIVDEAQISRHWGIFFVLGLAGMLWLSFVGIYAGVTAVISDLQGITIPNSKADEIAAYFMVLICFFTALAILALLIKTAHLAVCYLTRLPIRLNRKTQKIYVIRSEKIWQQEVWEFDWHDPSLFFCISHPHEPRKKTWTNEEWHDKGNRSGLGARTWYEIRCYQLDDKGIIQRAFVIGDAFLNGIAEAHNHWEYYRRYMSEGPQNLRLPHLFWRADERNSLIEMFAVCKGRSTVGVVALLELLTLPITLLIHLPCRVLSLWTSREARWPDEVEAACKIEPDDPWARPFPNQPIGWANNEDRHKKDWGWLSSAERYAPEKLEQWRSLYEPAQQWAEQRYPTDETV